jgi:hypothetical protein
MAFARETPARGRVGTILIPAIKEKCPKIPALAPHSLARFDVALFGFKGNDLFVYVAQPKKDKELLMAEIVTNSLCQLSCIF